MIDPHKIPLTRSFLRIRLRIRKGMIYAYDITISVHDLAKTVQIMFISIGDLNYSLTCRVCGFMRLPTWFYFHSDFVYLQ